ncbi:methyl-coenzyme M reductase operon protein D [Methanoplanus limicola]|jgi:methyl-coenzyme M reductase subunit D|uniref:Methyl-coenzyme M reductase operon protein D n=1 Tax=Methanoplanus limicola DSM 2279 TaxID=937775 RepID=H1YXI2_9EURY|nr:methyl-coenzyme M reductase operon protein D [Methanoplanus limicola]EHQ36919.1 methyl-coenzyme M reductase operon protein D [Methanoplanus limicola DSM 2279]
MTESQKVYPQCRVVPLRMLSPDTTEIFLDKVVKVKGIRRMTINGPSLPKTVPYGPARGKPNPNTNRRTIQVGDSEVELRVQAGMFVFELEDEGVTENIRAVCDEVFTKFPYQLQVGKYMKTSPTLSDYCKYGPDADEKMVGLSDPRKDGPVIIQGLK